MICWHAQATCSTFADSVAWFILPTSLWYFIIEFYLHLVDLQCQRHCLLPIAFFSTQARCRSSYQLLHVTCATKLVSSWQSLIFKDGIDVVGINRVFHVNRTIIVTQCLSLFGALGLSCKFTCVYELVCKSSSFNYYFIKKVRSFSCFLQIPALGYK